jgi:hypothetical protein
MAVTSAVELNAKAMMRKGRPRAPLFLSRQAPPLPGEDDPPFLDPPLRLEPPPRLFAPLRAPPVLADAPVEALLDLARPALLFDLPALPVPPVDFALLLRPAERDELVRLEGVEGAFSPRLDPPRSGPPGDNILRTTSEAAETKAAPILAALSAAASALCAASRPACLAVLRTFAFDERAAAAATKPAASMLRATGF